MSLAAMTASSGIQRLLIGEVDGEEPMRSVETLELYVATLGEFDFRVRDELAYDVRDENLPAERLAGNSRSVVHRSTEEAVGFLNRIARVDADPDPIGGEPSANVEISR